MQAHAHRVHGRLEQLRRHGAEQRAQRPIRVDDVPHAVDDQRGRGLVAGEHRRQRVAHRLHRQVGELRLGVQGRVAGGQEQRVALSQRHIEMLGEV